MKVKLTTNLSRQDAGEIGLSCDQCQAGKTVTVSEHAAETMMANGWCEAVEIKATPKKPAISKSAKSIDKATEDVKKYVKDAKGE